MSARGAVLAALAVTLVAVVVVVARSGDNRDYKVFLQLSNAEGLREGRAVKIGGADVGKIKKIELGRGDLVQAELALDRHDGRVGKGASATIKPTNLLGEKFVELDPGDRSAPEPSGVVIPRSRVTGSVDLDQVINVLDADTRTRLGILINEAGLGMTGRRADFSSLLAQLPPSLDSARALVGELVSDNHTLARLIVRGERFASRVTPERRALARMIDSAGETMRTLSARRAQLRDTVERAPGALSTLQRFLAELRLTTRPLGPAARAISRTGPALTRTLSALDPFRRAAEPTLAKATAVAPTLTTLGTQATPVLRRSNPALRSLTAFARSVAPVTGMLGHGMGVNTRTSPGGIDDILDTMHEWAQTIQTRDGLSHVFRGWLNVTPDQLRQFLERFVNPRRPAARAEHGSPGSRGEATKPAGKPLPGLPPQVRRALRDAVKGLGLPAPKRPETTDAPVLAPLLDYLLKR